MIEFLILALFIAVALAALLFIGWKIGAQEDDSSSIECPQCKKRFRYSELETSAMLGIGSCPHCGAYVTADYN